MYYPDDPGAQPVAEAVALLNRRWKLIAGTALLAIVAIVGFGEYKEAIAEDTFEAATTLGVNPTRVGTAVLSLEQKAQVLTSPSTELNRAARDAVGPHPNVEVEASANTADGSLRISARGNEPQRVTEVAAGYATALVDFFAAADDADFQSRLTEQQARVDAAAATLDLARLQLAADPENPRLIAEQQSALASYEATLASLAAIEAEGAPDPEMQVLTPAFSRKAEIGGFTGLGAPQRAAAGLVLGLMLGVGLAYLREALDRRIRSSEAAAEAFGVPVLSEIPHGGKAFEKGEMLAPPGTVVTEGYRRLRTILELERQSTGRPSGQATVVLVTSPSPSEGKTTTVAHLCRALGEVGNRVLAVSADFRRPKLHRLLDVEANAGLAGLAGLADEESLNGSSALIQEAPLDNVHVVTAGKGSHDTTALLRITKKLIEEARSRYDFIVIDTAPLLSANDALELVSCTDVVVVVAKFRQTSTPAAERTRDMLVNTSAPLLGVVVTGIHAGDGYGSYYYYGGYEPEPQRRGPRRSTRESV